VAGVQACALPIYRILAALPDGEREQIVSRLEPFEHSVRDMVYRQGERIDAVVFPLSGVFSLVVESDGLGLEVATVGNEGFVGLPVFLQATLTGAHQVFSQVEGSALRMDAAEFLDVVNHAGALRTVLQRYAMALMTQIARGSACNRLHAVDQRASRWILQTHDRVASDRFTLNDSFLAQMLGEEAEVTREVVKRLSQAGLIGYDGDELTVLDRGGLERTSCDCYTIVRAEYDRLLAA